MTRKKLIERLRERNPHPLKCFLAENKITQSAVATELGINRGLIYLFLNGKSVPPLIKARLEKFSKELGVQS